MPTPEKIDQFNEILLFCCTPHTAAEIAEQLNVGIQGFYDHYLRHLIPKHLEKVGLYRKSALYEWTGEPYLKPETERNIIRFNTTYYRDKLAETAKLRQKEHKQKTHVGIVQYE